MSTGLFIHRTRSPLGPRKTVQAANRERRHRELMWHLAGYMEEEVPIKDAAKALRISPSYATRLVAEIRRKLGAQAC